MCSEHWVGRSFSAPESGLKALQGQSCCAVCSLCFLTLSGKSCLYIQRREKRGEERREPVDQKRVIRAQAWKSFSPGMVPLLLHCIKPFLFASRDGNQEKICLGLLTRYHLTSRAELILKHPFEAGDHRGASQVGRVQGELVPSRYWVFTGPHNGRSV